MIEEESEVFEITDFTTASDWERFIAHIEEIIHDWKLSSQNSTLTSSNKLNTSSCLWQEINQEISFSGINYLLTHHFLTSENSSDTNEHVEPQEELPSDKTTVKGFVNEDEESGDIFPATWQDLMSSENDFPSRAHCLYRWFGLRNFILLQPAPGREDIMSENRLNMLLSSLAIAQHNTGCQVPILIQIHEAWRRLYKGQFECSGFRTSFEMIHLRTVSEQNHFLTGLLDIFKSKMASPMMPLPPVNIAVRFTYVLQDWPAYSWPQLPPDITNNDSLQMNEFGDLPFGACEDPVEELHLSAVWPSLSEDMIVESEVYSDLDPCQASVWTVKAKMTESPQCLLSDYLLEFIRLCWRTESTEELLKHSLIESQTSANVDASQALQRLTDPLAYSLHRVPSIGAVVTHATSKLAIKPEEAPIASDVLNEILLFLFPDARSSSDNAKKQTENTSQNKETTDSQTISSNALSAEDFKEIFRQLKSAPINSLTHRLAICMCIVNHSLGGVRAVAHLWQEIVLEMRYRWDNVINVIDIEPGPPNLGCSLMHQKFQMLNCCIEHKRSRQSGRSRTSTLTSLSDTNSPNQPSSPHDVIESGNSLNSSSKSDQKNSDDDDDEFFECNENSAADDKTDGDNVEDNEDDKKPVLRTSESEGTFGDPTEMQKPEGRLKPLDDSHLLNLSDEKLYIPITQEPAPMTEDMLEEQSEILARLGTSPEGVHLRARMQSACLLSDMEAFKAANPGCCLGDFVRWYSPRDWVLDDETENSSNSENQKIKGHLSHRMQIPGNTWLEAWQMAQAIPVSRQRRLFDDTKEAEKVLRWFSLLRPADVACRLMPSLVHAAILKIMEQDESRLPIIQSLLTSLSGKATKILRQSRTEVKRFEELVKHLSACEVLIIRAQSLKTKLSDGDENTGNVSSHALNLELHPFLSDVLERPEVHVPGASHGPLGSVIKDLFTAAHKQNVGSFTEMAKESSSHSVSSISSKSSQQSNFPLPIAKEYILRTIVKRPAPWSRVCPQRMFCVIMKDDFRLAGAFTADTTFQ